MPVKGGTAYRQGNVFKEYIRERDGHTCQTCGRKEGDPGVKQMDVAHIIPYDECGTTTPDNVRLLCHSCNKREGKAYKNARPAIDQWWASVGAQAEG